MRSYRFWRLRLHSLGAADHPDWHLVKESKFLDASRSPSPYRAFWVPFVSSQRVTWASYYVSRNSKLLPETA